MKVLIIGGVAGGAGAATRLRRLDESADIIIFERGKHVSYANCGLPYYLGGEIKGEENLTVATPAFLKKRFNIDVRVNSEVVAIDLKARKISVRSADREYTESYDKLVLAPGAKANTFGISGDGVFTLKDVTDTLSIDAYIASKEVTEVLVAGGGFIGTETAENLAKRGIKVTLAEFGQQIMPPLDPEIAIMVQEELEANGIKVLTGVGIKSVKNVDDGIEAEFTDSSRARFGAVVLAMGVKPESALAEKAGLKISPTGGIATDDYMLTSDENVYAAGDAVAVIGADGTETLVPLAGPANRQARSVATNIAGGKDSNGRRVFGASVVKAFSLTAACVGKNEKQLKAAGVKYLKAYAFPMSHAGYYPGAKQMALKLLFAPDGKVLGAEGAGKEFVEKQIDVISAVMKFGGTVNDLAELELCYAPPFNSAKSPVNMLGFIAQNILTGLCPTVYPEELTEDAFVLDVRNPSELASGRIPGSVNVPLDELRSNLYKIPKNRKIIVSCAVGLRGYLGVRILKQAGFDAYNLSGGFKAYTLLKKAGKIR